MDFTPKERRNWNRFWFLWTTFTCLQLTGQNNHKINQ